MKKVSMPHVVSASSETPNIELHSTNDIIYKYRIYNGLLQYCRWNQSKQCWIDSRWINC